MPPKKPPEALFAAVHVPRFLAQALSAERADLRGRAFAVVEQNASSHKTLIAEFSGAAAGRVEREGLGRHFWPGMPAFLAQRKWARLGGDLPVLPRDPAAEARLRERMRALWTRCTPEFAVRANGGAMLDMTGTPAARKFAPEDWAAHLQAHLFALGLEEATLGVASSQVVARVLARLSAERGNPRGILRCPAGGEARLLDPLPPSLLPGLSSRARERLKKYGLDTIGAVSRLDREELTLRFGSEGETLHALARGFDLEPVAPKRRSVSVETVLPLDLNDEEALRNQVRLTADKLAHALRIADPGPMKASRFSFVLTYSDGRSARRTVRVDPPTSAFVPLADAAVAAFFAMVQRRVALRRLQLVVAMPAAETGQKDLFEEPGAGKQASLAAAIDRIRAKRAFGSLLSASNIGGPILRRQGGGSKTASAPANPDVRRYYE